MKNKLLTLTFLLFAFMQVCAQSQSPIFEINKKLGKGINMGNMFEAPSEGEWGNPFKDDYFKKIADLGFNHVRVPIKWDVMARAMQSSPYTINKAFLDRIKFVVDKALAENLLVIVNMHHHDEIFTNPDNAKPRFLSQWTQISEFFKGYDNRLVFEVMNEPHDALTPEKWNVFFSDALQIIRKTNPKRGVLIGPANYNSLGSISSLKVPKDDNLILTLHYYDPFNFTHQGAEWIGDEAKNWLGTKWENTNLERNEIIGQFNFAINYAKQNNLPIHIGEFGAYSKADLDSRVKWSNFLARHFDQQGFSWAYWEFSAGFGIYNPTTNQVLTPLSEALLKTPMAAANVLKTKALYESNFTNGDDGWVIAVQPTATASFNTSAGVANLAVTKASAESWHVQFLKANIPLKKDRRYLVSFEAQADKAVGITNYIGKASDPYNAYSGYKGFSITTDKTVFTYSFVMALADDPKGRIVFDFGSNLAKIAIKNIKVEEVVNSETEQLILANDLNNTEIIISPNPSFEILNLKNITNFAKIKITNSLGNILFEENLKGENEKEISIKNLSFGQYIVILEGQKETISKKIIKF
jgi:endoglucanase